MIKDTNILVITKRLQYMMCLLVRSCLYLLLSIHSCLSDIYNTIFLIFVNNINL